MVSAPSTVPSRRAWPPPRELPPTATAAKASSSVPRPIWLASLAELMAITTSPATPAHRPSSGLAAAEGAAAHRYSGYGIEFSAQADLVGVTGGIDGDHHQSRDTGTQAGDRIHGELDTAHREGRHRRGPLVAADGEHIAAEARAAHGPQGRGDNGRHDKGLGRDAEQGTLADPCELRHRKGLQVAIDQHLGNAAPGDKQDQRRDNGLDAETRHQPSVEQPEQPRYADRYYDCAGHGQGGIADMDDLPEEDHRRQHPGDRHQRAH